MMTIRIKVITLEMPPRAVHVKQPPFDVDQRARSLFCLGGAPGGTMADIASFEQTPRWAAAPTREAVPAHIPYYLSAHYWWAYVHPRAVKVFERQWLVNLILWEIGRAHV